MKCHEYPFCTGHPGPTPEEQEAARAKAARRVEVKRRHRLFHAIHADWCPACLAIEETK